MFIDVIAGAISLLFLLFVASYYVLLILPRNMPPRERLVKSLTVIIPAHNEQRTIAACVRSVQEASWRGKRTIIVVDDGSKDDTARIARTFKGVIVLQQAHTGKAASINRALRRARSDAIAIVDADSVVGVDSFVHLRRLIERRGVAAATGVIKVSNRTGIGIWLHVEQVYNSLIRSLLAKLNANAVTPGPLNMFRLDALREIGGFGTEGFAEDVDVTIRLVRKGYRTAFSEKAVAWTTMPVDVKGFLRQRTRFARGTASIIKRHLRFGRSWVDLYTLPLFLLLYVQAVVLGGLNLFQIFSGYLTYFVQYGIYFNAQVAGYFFNWLSIFGFGKWVFDIATGAVPLTPFIAIVAASSLLSYPLLLIAMVRFDRLDWRNIIALCFMFPFWLLVMAIYIVCVPDALRRKQPNIWKKNE